MAKNSEDDYRAGVEDDTIVFLFSDLILAIMTTVLQHHLMLPGYHLFYLPSANYPLLAPLA